MLFRLLTISFISILLILPAQAFAVDSAVGDSTLTRDQRLSGAVTEQQLVLDDANKTLLSQRCVNAQALLLRLQDKSEKQVILINNTYSSFQKELLAMKLRAARQGVDASEIDLLIGKLQQRLDLFTVTANAYGMSLDDVASVDCVQKPEYFKAGLVLLRARQGELQATVQNLRTTIRNAQKDTFEQLKNRLQV